MLLCTRYHLQRILPVLCALAVLCAFMVHETRARPFGQERRNADVNPFPDSIDTAENASRHNPCYKEVTETFSNGTKTRVVTVCCDGYKGDNCDEKDPEPTSGDERVEFDPADPCKNLECRDVEGAQCLTISRCGERYPVFLLTDGTLAQCTNGQPVDVTTLTCSERCNVDPCAGQTCAMHPNAICVRTACTCNEPMWLLDTGVQVDCDTGEQLSPEEAKERRRRRKREASDDAQQQRTSCS